jgi:hypothetical protein
MNPIIATLAQDNARKLADMSMSGSFAFSLPTFGLCAILPAVRGLAAALHAMRLGRQESLRLGKASVRG